MQEAMPVMQEDLSNVVARVVSYTNQKGTNVTQQRFYASQRVGEDTKWKQIKNVDVLTQLTDGFASEDVSATSPVAEAHAAIATASPLEAQTQTAEGAPVSEATVATIGAAAVRPRGFFGGMRDRAADKLRNGYDNFKMRTRRKVGAVAMVATSIAFLATGVGGETPVSASPQVAAAVAPNQGHGNNDPHSPTDLEKEKQQYDHDQALKVVAEAAAETQRVNLETALTKRVGEATSSLAPNQFSQITNYDQVFGGPFEASAVSINGALGLENATTLNGLARMGSQILTGTGPYNESYAKVGRDAYASKGVPAEVVEKIAKGDFTDLMMRGYVINSSTAVYHNIAYRGTDAQGNATLAFDSERTVGANDVYLGIAYQKADGTSDAVLMRGDCGGTGGQVFDSISIPKPSQAHVHAPRRTVSTPARTTTHSHPGKPTRPTKPGRPTKPDRPTTNVGPKQNPHVPGGGKPDKAPVEAPVAGPSTPVIVRNPNTSPPANVILGTPPNLPPASGTPDRPN